MAAGVLERWREGHEKADVSVDVAAGVAPDDAAALLVSELVAFIKKNPDALSLLTNMSDDMASIE